MINSAVITIYLSVSGQTVSSILVFRIFFILLICFYFLTIISSWLNILSLPPTITFLLLLSVLLFFLSPLQSSGFAFLVEKCAGGGGWGWRGGGHKSKTRSKLLRPFFFFLWRIKLFMAYIWTRHGGTDGAAMHVAVERWPFVTQSPLQHTKKRKKKNKKVIVTGKV